MTDTRSPDELVDAVIALQARFEDFESTLTVRVAGRPTGTIEPTFESGPKSGTLVLNGQTVSRTIYPILFQYATDRGLFTTGLFGTGDGSTTFSIPDIQGRMLIGVGTGGGDTYTLGETGGSASQLLAAGMMPVHNHGSIPNHDHGGTGFTNTVGGHTHGGSGFTNTVGNHGGHASGTANVVPPGSGVTLPSFYNAGDGGHNHTIDLGGSAGGHNHTVVQNDDGGHTHANAGGTTPVPIVPPYIAVNFLIYV